MPKEITTKKTYGEPIISTTTKHTKLGIMMNDAPFESIVICRKSIMKKTSRKIRTLSKEPSYAKLCPRKYNDHDVQYFSKTYKVHLTE